MSIRYVLVLAVFSLSVCADSPSAQAQNNGNKKPAAKKTAAKKAAPKRNTRNRGRNNRFGRIPSQILASEKANVNRQKQAAQATIKLQQKRIQELTKRGQQYRKQVPGLQKQVDQARKQAEIHTAGRIAAARTYNQLRTNLGGSAATANNRKLEMAKADLTELQSQEETAKDELEKRSRTCLSIKAKLAKTGREIAAAKQTIAAAQKFINQADGYLKRLENANRSNRGNNNNNRRNNNRGKRK